MVKIISMNNDFVELDSTIFRPSGGGQPSDNGMMKNDGFCAEIVEAIKQGDKILHKIQIYNGQIKVGDYVELSLNEKRRSNLTRMHTGEHLFYKCLEKFVKDLSMIKVNIDEFESTIFVNSKEITWGMIFKAEDLANMIINENRKVTEHHYTKEEAAKLEGVRIKIDRIKDQKVRVIEIEDFDFSACSGTHCHSTKEIGNLLVTRLNSSGNDSYEIRFKVDVINDLFELSQLARESIELVKSDKERLIATIKNLKENQESMKKQMRDLAKNAIETIGHEVVKDIKFYAKEFENYEKEILIKKAGELAKEKAIIAFINKTEKAPQLLITVGKELEHDASLILKDITSKYGGKGGGKKDFAMGSFDIKHLSEIFNEIRKKI